MVTIYRGKWEWIVTRDGQEFWRPPGGNAIDQFELRNLAQMGTPGPIPMGDGIFIYNSPQTHASLEHNLGETLTETIRTQDRMKLVNDLGLGERLIASNMRDILLELLNKHADPAGITRWKPVRGSQSQGFKFSVGGFGQVINEPFGESHPFWDVTLGIWQADYRRNRAEVDAGRLSLELLQRFTGASINKYRVGHEILLPHEHIRDGFRIPRTEESDDFNRPNEALDAGNWDETLGIWDVFSNEARFTGGGAGGTSDARFRTGVSTDDHECEVTFTSAATPGGILGSLVRFASGARTYYVGYGREAAGIRQIGKLIAGVFTNLALDAGGTGPPHVFRLRIDADDLLQLFQDDVLILSVSGETSITGNLLGGMRAHSAVVSTGDDWSLSDLIVPPPPLEPHPEYGQRRAAIGNPSVYGATIVRS